MIDPRTRLPDHIKDELSVQYLRLLLIRDNKWGEMNQLARRMVTAAIVSRADDLGIEPGAEL